MTRAPDLPDAACHGMADQWTAWEAATLHELHRNTRGRSRYIRELAALTTARDALDTCIACPTPTRIACWQWARADGYEGIAGGALRYSPHHSNETIVAGKIRRPTGGNLPEAGELAWLLE